MLSGISWDLHSGPPAACCLLIIVSHCVFLFFLLPELCSPLEKTDENCQLVSLVIKYFLMEGLNNELKTRHSQGQDSHEMNDTN